MSKPQRKAVWLILDAAGYEITRRCLEAGLCPSLSTIRTQGYLGPSRPPQPNCETPPALRALFAGTEPPENGIWGYQMPDYQGRLERAVSGFAVPTRGAPAIWEELEQRGQRYTLINVAFRKDPVWGRGCSHFDLVLDGYRNYRYPPRWYRLEHGHTELECAGARLRVSGTGNEARIKKGRRTVAAVSPGQIVPARLTRKASALFYNSQGTMFCFPSSPAHLRPGAHAGDRFGSSVPESIYHGNLFRFGRESGLLSTEQEMKLSEIVTAQMGELALWAASELASSLIIVYFSLIDELCHVYLDQIVARWPEGREAELLGRCYGLLDSWVGRIMERIEGDDLLILSSDHGQIPFGRAIRVNDLLAEADLVRRAAEGYDLRRSLAYYHPSNCGQVVVNRQLAKKAGLSRDKIVEKVVQCLEQARTAFNVEISYLEGGEGDPYLLFLYPMGDTHITGRSASDAETLDPRLRGGHHLSPLCPTPWIQAMLGLWSPAGLSFEGKAVPDHNTGMKDLLLRYLSGA